MTEEKYFLEVEYFQIYKDKNKVPGDIFISSKSDDEKIISVLSDGLGSGIKANVLATLSATMASQFIKNNIDIKKSARIIIDTLPICNVRKVGYSTFTVSEINKEGEIRVIEYDNPPFLYFRGAERVQLKPEVYKIGRTDYKEEIIHYYQFRLNFGDRLVFVSDGVTQSGMGREDTPLGWGNENLAAYVEEQLQSNSDLSARELAKKVVIKGLQHDEQKAHDDITCGVIYCRQPRKLLVVSGPPIDPQKDKVMAEKIKSFDGQKIVSGGTTANILSRELNVPVEVDLFTCRSDVPPESTMKGIDLVTEGILTLCKVSRLLEEGYHGFANEDSAATKMVEILLDNDIIEFLVGTKINEVHQDPTMPVDIEIRRNIIRKIMRLLEEKYMKQTELHFL